MPVHNDTQTDSSPRKTINWKNLITGLKTIIKSLGSFVGVFLLLAIYIVGGIYLIIDTLIVNIDIFKLSFLNISITFDKL